jgi:hypothetical protein
LANFDWAFINSFAGWFSGLATFLAVIVSLYLATIDWRVRLRVNVGVRTLYRTGDERIEGKDAIVISVTNVGRRTALVTGLFWANRLVRRRYVHQDTDARSFSAHIPIKLGDGDGADFVFMLEEFKAKNDAVEFGKILPRPRLWTASCLGMIVRTSSGRSFRVRTEKKLRQELVNWVEGTQSSRPLARDTAPK